MKNTKRNFNTIGDTVVAVGGLPYKVLAYSSKGPHLPHAVRQQRERQDPTNHCSCRCYGKPLKQQSELAVKVKILPMRYFGNVVFVPQGLGFRV